MPKSIFRIPGRNNNPDKKRICRLKIGDRVQMMSGKNIKAVGNLKKVMIKHSTVVVEGVNLVTKHAKMGKDSQAQSGIIKIEAPVHVSKVALVCPKCLKPTRVGVTFVTPDTESGEIRKVRVCKRCQAHIDE
jgi:large subunit ribosomal protein L24